MGASERHDFAVRVSTFVARTARAHRLPPRVRADREPPLCGTGPNRYSADLPPPSRESSENQKSIKVRRCWSRCRSPHVIRAGFADFSRRRRWQPPRGLEFKAGTTEFGFEFAWV